MKVTVCGAAGMVTGSAYLVETQSARVLVDCGMFQGEADSRGLNRQLGPIDPARLDAVVVTHAHIDHVGRLPLLAQQGFHGSVFATAATCDLARLLLEDSAQIQVQDLERLNRRRLRAGEDPLPPLYTMDDVRAIAQRTRKIALDLPHEVARGVSVTLREAGHILGSASVVMRLHDGARTATVHFSGDLGPRRSPILRDFEPSVRADLVFLESTYGDREHPPQRESVERFIALIREAIWNRERVLIPAFAVGRTQQVLYHLAEAVRQGLLPECPIYLDSPAARSATEVYQAYRELYDTEMGDLVDRRQMREDLRNLRIVESPAESRALNDSWDPCVIIAGSGMCEGGRIVHHLRHSLWRRGVRVILVGFAARGTLARELADGAERVMIFNEPVAVRAKVHTLSGFSAHAAQSELLEWVEPAARAGATVALTHGEDAPRAGLAAAIEARFGVRSLLPTLGQVIEV
ncbi:MAG: MBL fold metallo-hydrolase [Planctomycetota bacterium]|nr:MBL fold metallo-hydrolase [Planctomycetota bacterium]